MKKLIKTVVSYALVVTLALSNASPTFAAFPTTSGKKGTASFTTLYSGYSAQKSTFGSNSMEDIYLTSGGAKRRAFCIKPGTPIKTGSNKYTSGNKSWKYYRAAIWHYYEWVKDKYEDDHPNLFKASTSITQLCIWYSHKNQSSPKPSSSAQTKMKNAILDHSSVYHITKDSTAKDLVDEAIKNIYTQVDAHAKEATILEWTSSSAQTLLTGKTKEKPTYFRFKFTKSLYTENGAWHTNDPYLGGCKIGVYTNEACTTPAKDKDGKNVTITCDADGIGYSTYILYDESKEKMEFYLKEVSAGQGTYLSNLVKKTTVTKDKLTINGKNTVTATSIPNVQKRGQIIAKKVADGTEQTLSGATFQLYKYDSGGNRYTLVKTVTTNEYGEADFGVFYFNSSDMGKYMVKETKAPDGYELNPTPQYINLSDAAYNGLTNAVEVTKTFTDKPLTNGKVTVYKKDSETGELLNGPDDLFTLYEDQLVFHESVGYKHVQTGKTYFVKETGKVDYYRGEHKETELFEVTAEDNNFTFEIENRPNVVLPGLYKVDSEDNHILYEGQFELWQRGENGEEDELLEIVDLSKEGNSWPYINRTGYSCTHSYYWKEIKAPTGYKISNTEYNIPISTRLKDQQWTDTGVVEIPNDPIKKPIRVTKVSSSRAGKTPTAVGNAEFSLYRIEDENETPQEDEEDTPRLTENNYENFDYSTIDPIETFTTDAEGKYITEAYRIGKFVLVETKAPKNYLIAKPELVEIEESDGDYTDVEIVDREFDAYINVEKRDKNTGKLIPQEKTAFKIFDVQNNKYVVQHVYSNTTDNEGYETDQVGYDTDTFNTDETGKLELPNVLPIGEYRLEEVVAPDGYYTNTEPITFVVDDEADNYTVNEEQDVFITLVMEDEPTKCTFSKQDITNKEELPGAKLEVTDNTGKVVDSWTSTTEPHMIEGLLVGETYTMSETKPADGYATAESIEFTVTDTGVADEVVMYDDITKVSISKKDITNKEELPGARLKLTDSDGEVIDEWTSTKEPHMITKLTVGKTYTLTETKPADGYTTAESIKFVVSDTGKVQPITMYDGVTSVKITKYIYGTNTKLAGAKFAIYNSANKRVKTFTSTKKTITFTKLPIGTYTLKEISAPTGYAVAKPIKFTVKDTITPVEIRVYDKRLEATVKFRKVNAKHKKKGVEGAKYGLYSAKGKLLKTAYTNSKGYGKFKIKVKHKQKVYVKEIKAPSGFYLNKKKYYKTIKVKGKSNIVVNIGKVTDKPVVIKIAKIKTGIYKNSVLSLLKKF